MNTFGLGRQVHTFGLGNPYLEIPVEPPVSPPPSGGGAGGGGLIGGNRGRVVREGEWSEWHDKNKEAPGQRQRDMILREDQEMIEFITAILTKGII